jgi:septal ring factor EnvC (AmiA/AmiB activator)
MQLDVVLDRLIATEQQLAGEMIRLRHERDSLGDMMESLAGEYRNQTRMLFKQRLLTPDVSMLLLPEEHRALALRRHLFNRFTIRQQERARNLAGMMHGLAAKDSVLEQKAHRQRELIAAKRSEALELARQNETAERLSAARAADLRTIEGQILQLAEAGAATGGGKPEKKETKGKEENDDDQPELKWPVAGRRIVQGYGERINAKTRTVTLNPGVNIAASSGSSVKAAADGTVSLVTWLPSFGTVVIVEHKEGYRTVYANLASALVSRGRKVSAGQKIAVVGGSTDGEFLHFEVWRHRTRHDPLTFLK